MTEPAAGAAVTIGAAATTGAPGGTRGATTAGGATTGDWRGGLSEGYRAHAALQSYKSLDDLAKSHIEAQGYIGGAVRIPKPDATPEERQAFYRKLGRPDSPDGYKIEAPKNLPENVQWNPESNKGFLKAAHALGLTNAQAQGIIQFYADSIASELPARTDKAAKAARAQLEEAWGAATDKNLSFATRAIRSLGGDQLVEALARTGAGNMPELLIAFAKVGSMMAEDGALPGGGDAVPAKDTLQAELKGIMADPKHAYFQRSHPGHKDAVARVQRLHELLYL